MLPDYWPLIIEALNQQRLYHGTYTLMNINDVAAECLYEMRDKLIKTSKWSIQERCWHPFGGFYITSSASYAKQIANTASNFINMNNPCGHISVPMVHEVELLPSVLLALDEDEFNWDSACRNLDANWLRPDFPMDEQDLQEWIHIDRAGVMELEEEWLVEKNDDDLFDPILEQEEIQRRRTIPGLEDRLWLKDIREEVDKWTKKYAIAALEFWYLNQENIKAPNLRILSDAFTINPPLHTFRQFFRMPD